jgi:hypothetical protein
MYKHKKCKLRPDLVKLELSVPIGGSDYLSDPSPINYRWVDDEFQVYFNGKWQTAYSIDFEFN